VRKQTRNKPRGKLAKRPSGELERLADVPPDVASREKWARRLQALPLRSMNKALRENPEFLACLSAQRIAGGDILIGPLTAESNGDRAQGEHTFLVVLRPMRDRLVKEYGIRTGAEYMLLDVLVLSYYQYVRAATILHGCAPNTQSFDLDTLVQYAQTYLIRANELFLRNLEALRQLKATPFVIKIEQAGQVNVGEKQINVAEKSGPGAGEVTLARDNGGGAAPSPASMGPPALPEPDEGA